MSSNRVAKKSSSTPKKESKYCAHCFNIGKPESEYRSHYIRANPDPKSAVVCPELLSTKCRYCSALGHTVSLCPAIALENKKKIAEEKAKTIAANNAKQMVSREKEIEKNREKVRGKFAALMDDSSDDETPAVSMKVSKIEEFPSLCATKTTKTGVCAPSISYANMAAKTKEAYEDEQFLKNKMVRNVSIPSVAKQPIQCQVEYGSEEDTVASFEAEAQPARKPFNVYEDNWMIDSDDEDW
jgi:hypothetical protein